MRWAVGAPACGRDGVQRGSVYAPSSLTRSCIFLQPLHWRASAKPRSRQLRLEADALPTAPTKRVSSSSPREAILAYSTEYSRSVARIKGSQLVLKPFSIFWVEYFSKTLYGLYVEECTCRAEAPRNPQLTLSTHSSPPILPPRRLRYPPAPRVCVLSRSSC